MPSYQIFTPAIAEDFANEHSDLFGSQSKLTTVQLKESRQKSGVSGQKPIRPQPYC